MIIHMDNNNYTTNPCFGNSGFNSANSLTRLLDEDPNEFPCVTLSEYVDVNTFGKQLSQVKNKLKIILDAINQHHQISVICLQEAHLDENDSMLSFELNEYQLISKGRYCSNARGLIIYIYNYFNFKHVDISSETISDSAKTSWESLLLK